MRISPFLRSFRRVFFPALIAMVAGIVAGSSIGCTVTLEDGYKPKPLDASADVRKSYYASPFTDAANASNQGPDTEIRPGGL